MFEKSIFCIVATLAPSILIGSSSFLEETRITITSWMSSNLSQIRPWATIAHLRVNKYSHWTKCFFFFFLFFFENLIKIEDAGEATALKIDFSNIQGQLTAIQGRIWLKFKLIQYVMVILVSFKNEKDPIKVEGARVATIQKIDFSNTKGQLTQQSEVRSGRNSKSCEML